VNLVPVLRAIAVDVRIGLRNAIRQRRRSLFGLIAVAFSVVALVLANGFIHWIFSATREGTINSGLGHIQIVRPGYFKFGIARPFDYLLPDSAPERPMIEDMTHVKTLAPRLSFSGLVSRGDTTVSFIGDGIDPDREGRIVQTSVVREGEDLAPGDPTGVIMGRGLAQNLGVKPGDTIVLLVNTKNGVNAVEAKVRGLFTTISKAYDDVAVRTPLAMAQRLLRVKGTHRWIVFLDDTENTDRVLSAARTRFGSGSLEFAAWIDLADFYKKAVALLSQQMTVVKVILAGIIVLSVSNTLLMSVSARTSEIGTAMALGTRRRRILQQFLAESLTLGVFGALAGAVVGCTLALAISAIGIPMPPPPGQSQGYLGHILLTPGLVVEAMLLAVSTALLAGMYPAWRASRLEIVDALRHQT
jgi:putative ABC transport system permease protein